MANSEECEAALRLLAEKLDKHTYAHGKHQTPNRRVMCRIPDLGTAFSGELRDGQIVDIVERESPDAQIVLTLRSDDLIAVTDGTLPVATAWATGRLKIDASVRDLLRVRGLL
jgi:putative sterol carrier protein